MSARLLQGQAGERCCDLQPAQKAMIQHLAEGTFDIEQGLMPQSDSGEDGAFSMLLQLLTVALAFCALYPTVMTSLAETSTDINQGLTL